MYKRQGIVRAVIDMEFGVGKIISGDAVALQDRQGGLDRVEEGHRAGAACFQIDFLGDLRENDIGRYIFLRDAIAARGNGIEEDAPCAVCGGAGGVAAVDLFNEIGDALNKMCIRDSSWTGTVRVDFPPLRTVRATFTAHGAPSMQIICCVYVK